MTAAPTFRGRLAVAMTALAVTVLAITGATLYLAVARALDRDLDRALSAITTAEIASAFDEPGVGPHVHDTTLAPMGIVPGETEKVSLLLDRSGAPVARTHGAASDEMGVVDPVLLGRSLAEGRAYGSAVRAGRSYRVLYQSFLAPDRTTLVALVALPRASAEHTLGKLRAVLALTLAGGAAAAGLGATRLARRLTRPLEAIASAAHGIGTAVGDARIPAVSADREIAELVTILNQMLARVSEAVAAQQRFVADASHELRSPLTNLRGAIDVALRRPRSADDYRETLVVAQAEIERLVRLTRALLTLSRADAGQMVLARSCVDVNEVLRASAAAHRARAAEREVAIHEELDGAALADGDPDLLREVIDNLVDNALRYAPAGTIVTLRSERAGGSVRLEVEDQGAGVPDDRRQRIFERFERADAARDRASGGFGLGLAIVRAIVGAHGGDITVRDRAASGGAIFEVRLPGASVTAEPGE